MAFTIYLDFVKRQQYLSAIALGDVIFPNRGARNGQLSGAEPIAVLVPDSIPVGNVNPQVTRLKLCSDLIDNRFICFMLRTPDFLRQFGSVTGGTALAFILHAAMSETFSKRWNLRVMREAKSVAWVVERLVIVSSMAARKSAKAG